jgi:uroporphyrinogen III methyltransferase/synthase
MGGIVDEAFAYRTVPETRDDNGARRRLLEEGADLITFTSSSTVENYMALGLPWPAGMQVASIGPVTSKTARDLGLNVDMEARRHDIPGLVDTIQKFYAPKN